LGVFSSLFKKDWAAELDRAESLLEQGDPVQALEIARRVRQKAEDQAPRAAELAGVAKVGVRDLALANAEKSEAKGDLEDAADWLESAIEHEADLDERNALKRRIQSLNARLDGLVGGDERSVAAEGGADGESEAFTNESELDSDTHYEMLIHTVAEPLREAYDGRPESFRRALVDLSAGRFETALDALDPLAAESPEDGILRLETGRARSFVGDIEGALSDFDAAWDKLGEQSLDASDSNSAASLWAETAIEAERADEVVDRLRDPARLDSGGRIDVCLAFAHALIVSERFDEAVTYLQGAVPRAPAVTDLKYMLGWALREVGRSEEAIETFEEIAEGGCRVGCSRDKIHLPAFWALVRLYSERGEALDRARELLVIATNTQGGVLGARNYEILARYFDATGDEESAERSISEARRLHAVGEDAASSAGSLLS